MNVPHRAFRRTWANPFVNLPVNVGSSRARMARSPCTTRWKQLAYIFDWNTSCCWQDLRVQMGRIGLSPDDVTRFVIGHAHWDDAGQLSSFPNAVLYIQKEELKQIEFFVNYPADFNSGHPCPGHHRPGHE